MTSSKNGRVLLRARSAVKQGQRPTAAILESSNPYSSWERLDYIIQDAIFILEREVCPRCNNPIWICHSTDNSIDFKVVKRTCYATAELEDDEKAGKQKDLDPGQYTIAVPVGIENEDGSFEPLPSRHEAYRWMPDD